MSDYRFAGRDGVELACRETGSGRPLILLHGFAGGSSRWVEHGIADAIAAEGFRVVMPDFRGHGESTRPHDRLAYPADVLAEDGLALLDHLGLGDGEYDLVGYSLGGRIVVRMLVHGAKPGRAVVGGQGLAKVSGDQRAGANYRALTALVNGDTLDPGSPAALTARWISEFGADAKALLYVLDSLVPTSEEDLRRITTETLVALGDQDERSDGAELAALLPNGHYAALPGNHGTAMVAPEFAATITGFLAG
jgi:pimeloyl-ACP methyl ester carboxylesterase